ncbi:MAG: hypothetical protein GY845_22425 [Planctomycetes bacterium]|nr:hypothetical protein [Planctomycetota bacterium]
MSESIDIENQKQNRQKPPLSVGRIACEILAGIALCIVALLVVYVTGTMLIKEGFFSAFGFGVMCIFFFPPLFALASIVGVYLVGTVGKQTGSFWATLGWSLLGMFVMVILTFACGHLSVGTGERIVMCGLLLLIPPIATTYGFNLTRRYKEPFSS